MPFVIYRLLSPSGKSYIGKTNNISSRISQHKNAVKRGKKNKIYCALRKYGFHNFQIYVLENCKEENTAFELEKKYITFFNSYNNGYNSTLGGEGACGQKQPKSANQKRSLALKGIKRTPFTEDHKRKLSEAHKGLDNHQTGRKCSEETKKKISRANLGRKHSDEAKNKMKSNRGKI